MDVRQCRIPPRSLDPVHTPFRHSSNLNPQSKLVENTSAQVRVLRYDAFVSSVTFSQSSSSDFPAPGAYSPQTVTSTPKYMFGKAKRDLASLPSSDTPGPTAYNSEDRGPVSPQYSLGARHPAIYRSLSPGPTAYRVDLKTLSPRWTFGGSMRSRLASRGHESIPGPGAYDTENMKGHVGPSFSIKARVKSVNDKSSLPGPTSYGGLYTQFD